MPDLELTREVLNKAGIPDEQIEPEGLEYAAGVLDAINGIVAQRIVNHIMTGDSELAREIRQECFGENQN